MSDTAFAIPMWILAVGGVFVLGGVFAIIYWYMGRGGDDGSA